ncbi:uncharacterized protein LOC100837046 [Brachypodium distachyon]|uniref:Uncharacterized protein n=1 Tax=Brachypodium distachyon TaxID=15368 RepID=I1HAU1_BRADI|nr:uncharacterized protein LOC100837046 [Brachypodium distachyon]KQK24128.1 hypothetical protein BRADI_1g78300v3 [Brachypodium distachyon]KQK24129.1 hypothetical protein BRADI_1g78300v3 [Brachypodium distachyon]|eukprot:XP_010229346.1 uncharacterized protein LOC100837046 [Brachypodium distachyon]
MAAVMDLDLNCSPPSPEPAPQDHHLKHAMLRQENTFRHQVKDLHRLYWAQKNLTDVPFWMQSDDVLYARHSMDGSHVMDLDDRDNHPGVFGGSYELGKQAVGCGDEVAENLGVRGSVRRKLDHGGVQGRSAYRPVIDLEKPATLDDDDDDVEIVSSAWFSDYANRKGSTGSSETPDSHSPVKGKTTASGSMLIDLNIAQEDDFNVCPDPSKMFCSLLASSRTIQSGECCSNSSKAFHKGGESSIGSSKGSTVTVVTSISAPASAREVMASGLCDPQSSSKPSFVAASKHDVCLGGNIQHQHKLHNVSGMSSQGSMQIRCEVSSVRSSGGNSSSSGVHKLVDREQQGETFAVISDDEMEGIDLNVSLGSIELPSTMVSSFREKHLNADCSEKLSSSHYFTENEGGQNISSIDCPTIRDHHMAASIDAKSARLQDSGIATNRSILIPETPQGHDYACPRLRSSNNGASNLLDTTSRHQADTEEDERIAAKAAETLVSLFTNNAWIADSYCSNNQTAQDRSDEPQVSLDSFEEGVMNLEEMRDDGESVPVTAPDKDGPSCGIKLKRGRGMRDFQREILPGLVSLARHEICDDLHAIGYELRKTRSRRNPGDKCTPSTRSRLPRRCSTAWNQ